MPVDLPIALIVRTAFEVCCGSALFFTLLLLGGLWRLRRRRSPPPPAAWPPLAILRPCEGAEPDLLDNLRSTATAAYAGARRIFLLVPSRRDPAFAIAQEAAARMPSDPRCHVEVVITEPRFDRNRKVEQLAAGLLRCSEPIVVTIDSDVRLGDRELPALVAALQGDPFGPRPVAAAFAPPIEVTPRTSWDRASAALVGGSPQSFLALYGLQQLLGGVPKMAGALCALRRDALDEIGGFDGVREYLGEDHEIARRLRERGYDVAISPEPAACTDGGRDLRSVLARVVRWLTVVRAQRPLLLLTYPLFVAPTPSLLILLALYRSPFLSSCVPLLLGARVLLHHSLRRAQGQRVSIAGALLGVLAAEGLLLAGFIGACFTRHVRWRGHRFRVGAGGRLIADRRAAPQAPLDEEADGEVLARPEQRRAEGNGLFGGDAAEGPQHQGLAEQAPDQRQLRAPS